MTEGLRKEEDEEPCLRRMWTKGENWVRAARKVKAGPKLCPVAAWPRLHFWMNTNGSGLGLTAEGNC
jgi:hypothetical protein